ncbi:50S ribosomal protein L15 [Candidatus Saccharibacteria bacterium]|nr:50S ribosomal protein L15 [Candidatus Saccharibacteria bacterium]
MKYNELSVVKNKNRTRAGRGISAGKGKTAGRGTKGQNSRTGGGVRIGFEGGQNPLNQRMPKLRGFTSHRPTIYEVKLSELPTSSKNVDNKILAEANLIPTEFVKVKIINTGNVSKALNIKLQAASASAISAIEKAGGTFIKVDIPKRTKKDNTKN